MFKVCIQHCLVAYPNLQAIYLFGSWGTEDEKTSSDIDIALLLPIQEAKSQQSLYATALHQALEKEYRKDIDLINLRCVATVLQKEITCSDRRIYCADSMAADEFEMLTVSYYQKLNAERADILQNFYTTKRAINL